MATLSYPVRAVGLAGFVAAQIPQKFTGAGFLGPHRVRGDLRFSPPAEGTVLDNARVMFKADASAPEQPMAGARVRLHHLRTGACVWQGTSDTSGYYYPRGLQVGERYVPVAIDLHGNFECVAAGPVVAVEP